jgi:Domain of unknown function (DUF4189)
MLRVLPAALAAALWIASAGIAHARDYYGAIAYSPSTGAYGFSYDHYSQAEAENRAMAECRARAGDCQLPLWFRNACGALAVGSGGGWGTGWGTDQGLAESYAIQTCSRNTNSCQIIRWVCTTR